MPQNCQIIGVNSVTNIDPGKGVMPAPIIRNADWFEKNASARIADRVLKRTKGCPRASGRACDAAKIVVPYLVQDSGKWPIY
jgi:hypothetical protein